ncbi:PIN domain-containing protein [Leptospira levettii]|uniref:N-acetyltransferase domain-containing protein n=1 Tax=Leptospira levettii TaxID=2023178 RepID=A0AAW5VBI9_9LEPT|nr:hypothetical protein [Leptospira levettii]MCW7512105.1 hypothetical protein [Leptospira levettii]MCW7517156.1 hypothetical protein [Leptospira levettii]
MRILIDTNILIHFEDHKHVSEEFYRFYNHAIKNHCRILVHPSVFEDLSNDSNLERQKIITAKLEKYEKLENPAEPDQEFYNLYKPKNSNDKIDAKLIYQAVKGYIELLITEDTRILKTSKNLKIESRVKNIKEGLDFLIETFRFDIPAHPILSHGSVREIIERKNETFFDSLRQGYKKFDLWLDDCAKQDRLAYYLIIEEKLSALLIYKKETPFDHKIKDIYEDVLKICTFKVGETNFGNKIGELFLSKMFAYCIEAKINYLYLTVYPEHDRLIRLLELYGFVNSHSNGNGEFIMIREMKKPENTESSNENSSILHPYYSDNFRYSKFIVPIEEIYSESLFKDSRLREAKLFDKESINEIQGNTIQKAYICNSRVKLEKKDLIFFYISRTIKKASPIGIVDSYHRVSEMSELANLVTKRTVYPINDLQRQLEEKKTLTVILFRLITYMKTPLPYQELKSLNSCRNNLTTITRLTEEDYSKIKNKGFFDERYIIN